MYRERLVMAAGIGGPPSEGIVHGTSVTCPLHNRKIDLASGEATGPDQGCIDTCPAKIEQGQVYLSVAIAQVAV